MKSTEYLHQLHAQNAEMQQFVKSLEAKVASVLSINPSPGSWSVAQCLDHMNMATELYLDQIEKKLDTLIEGKNDNFRHTLLAKYFADMQLPGKNQKIRYKVKTFKFFLPPSDLDPQFCLDRFLNNQDRFEQILNALAQKDLRSFRVVTALGPILKFYVGDALNFVMAHNLRHIQQIRNVLSKVDQPAVSQRAAS